MISIGLGLGSMPGTDSIMGAVPKDRAGVGSATNDTTREIGCAPGRRRARLGPLWTFADPATNGLVFAILIGGIAVSYVAVLVAAISMQTRGFDRTTP